MNRGERAVPPKGSNPSTISLNQIRYFAKVADMGSMSAAADELFVAQSAISMAISQLETALDCQLLVRHRARGVELTENGRQFYFASREVLLELENAIDVVRPGSPVGTLTAGCFTTLAQFWIPPLVEEILGGFPDLNVDIVEYSAQQLEAALTKREVEIALAYDFDYGTNIDFHPLGSMPLYAAFPENHSLAHEEEVDLAQLANLPLVLLDLGKSTNYFLSVFHQDNLTPKVKYRFGSFEAVRSMVARGHGYTILNQAPSHDLTNEGLHLVRVPLRDNKGAIRIGCISRRGEQLTRRAEIFLAACTAVAERNISHPR